MNRLNTIANRSLPSQGPCAFAHADHDFGFEPILQWQPSDDHRPAGSLGKKDWMHPGKGSD